MTPMQQLFLALDAAVTGIAPERAAKQYQHQPTTVEEWFQQGGGNPIWYLADGGYSRVVWDPAAGTLGLTSNSTDKAKANWAAALPQRQVVLDYLNQEFQKATMETQLKKTVNTLLESEDALQTILGKAKESTAKFRELSGAIDRNMPDYGAGGALLKQQLGTLNHQYRTRDTLLARIQYSLAYRKALEKAGVALEEVAKNITGYSNRKPLYGENPHGYITMVELKDRRRVEIDPVKIFRS